MKGNDAKAKAYMYSVVKETIRCAKNAPGKMRPVLPYGWDHYHDGAHVLSVETLKNQLQIPCDLGASGMVEWGNSKQVANESYWKWFVTEGSGAITKKFVCDHA